jgi:hypothetical protein
MDSKARFDTIAGSIFTIMIMQPNELLSTFIIGAVGAVGAYCGHLMIKFVVDKVKIWIKRTR